MIGVLSALGVLVLLGVVQGATEFLPVSSHGHLVLLEHWLEVGGHDALARDVLLHMGTLAAVLVFCRRDLLAMLRPGSGALWRVVLPATLITAVAGLSLEHIVESALSSPNWLGAGLFVNALFMGVLAPRDDSRQVRSLEQGTVRDGIVLGLLQSLALMPSVSRSASTIVAALWLGYARRDAVRVAFLVSVPAVAGAVSLSLMRGSGQAALHAPGMTAGLLSAFLVGLLALRFLTLHVDARSLRAFALYCLLLGTVVILVG